MLTFPVKKIFLIGFMGAGKTTLGAYLAHRLQMNFVDLDVFIQENELQKITQIFEEKGEDYFRNLETKYLHQIPENTLVACGGGTPCFNNNIDFLKKNGCVIYLNLSVENLLKNICQTNLADRPLLKGKSIEDLEIFISENLFIREPYYFEADIFVNPIKMPVKRIAQILVEKINK